MAQRSPPDVPPVPVITRTDDEGVVNDTHGDDDDPTARIRYDVLKMHRKLKLQKQESDLRWAAANRRTHDTMGEVMQVEMEHVPDEEEVLDMSQRAWLAQEKKNFHSTLNTIHAEAMRIEAGDIIKVLPHGEITVLKERFEMAEHGNVTQQEFTDLLMTALRKHRSVSADEEAKLMQGLVELFLAIDFDSSGLISWEEFTHYVVHSGDNSESQSKGFRPYQHFQTQNLGRVPSRGVSFKWLPGLEKMMSISTSDTDSVVKIFNPQAMEDDVYGQINHRCTVIASEFIPGKDRLFLATEEGELEHYYYLSDAKMHLDMLPLPESDTDLVLARGMSSKKARCRSAERTRQRMMRGAKRRLRHISTMKCEFPSLNLHWDSDVGLNGLLFSGARSGDVFGYDIAETYTTPNPVPTVHCHIQAHTEPISCLTTLPGQFKGPRKLISASFFGRVTVTDLVKNQSIELRGNYRSQRHHQGVYSVDYNTYYNLLITAGFEPDPILWLPTQSHNQFIARLTDTEDPHKHSILAAKMIPGTDNIVSCDTAGMFKLWDIRRIQCINTWHLHRTLSTPGTALEVMNFLVEPNANRRVLYCTARNGMNGIDMHTLYPAILPTVNNVNAHNSKVVDVRYNPTTKTFISVSAKEVKIWKAESGVAVFSACDVVVGDISCLCLDEAGRRFILGTNKGGVTVHSYATGAMAQTLKGTTKEVCAVLYMTHSKMICTGTASGQILLYQDSERSESHPHQTFKLPVGVTAMAYSNLMHLFAVGDVGEELSMYDAHSGLGTYRLLTKMCYRSKIAAREEALRNAPGADADKDARTQPAEDRTRLEGYMFPSFSEVTATVFLMPYPAIAMATAVGNLLLYTVRPYPQPYQLITSWKSPRPRVSHLVATVTTAMKFIVRQAQQLLVTGDDHGYVVIYDMRELSISVGLQPTQFPMKEMYQTDCQLSQARKPRLHAQWKVAPDPITAIDVVPGVSVLTIACGDNVILYSLDGTKLGQLCQGRARGVAAQPDDLPDYDFSFDSKRINALRIFSAVHHRVSQQAGDDSAPKGVAGGAAALRRKGRSLLMMEQSPPASPTGLRGQSPTASPREGRGESCVSIDAASVPGSPRGDAAAAASSPVSRQPSMHPPGGTAGLLSATPGSGVTIKSPLDASLQTPQNTLVATPGATPLHLPGDLAPSEVDSEPPYAPGSPRNADDPTGQRRTPRKKKKKEGQQWGFLKTTIENLALTKQMETVGLDNIVAGISMATVASRIDEAKSKSQTVSNSPTASPRHVPDPCSTPDPPPIAMPKHAANLAIHRVGRLSPTKKSARHMKLERDAVRKTEAYHRLLEDVERRGNTAAAAAEKLREELGGKDLACPKVRNFLQIARGIRWENGWAVFSIAPKKEYAEPLQSTIYAKPKRRTDLKPEKKWMAEEIRRFQALRRSAAESGGEGLLIAPQAEDSTTPRFRRQQEGGSPSSAPRSSANLTPRMLLQAAKDMVRRSKLQREEVDSSVDLLDDSIVMEAVDMRPQRTRNLVDLSTIPDDVRFAEDWVEDDDLRDDLDSQPAAQSPMNPALRPYFLTPQARATATNTLATPSALCLPQPVPQLHASIHSCNDFATASAGVNATRAAAQFTQLLHSNPLGANDALPAAMLYPFAESPYLCPGRAPPVTPKLTGMLLKAQVGGSPGSVRQGSRLSVRMPTAVTAPDMAGGGGGTPTPEDRGTGGNGGPAPTPAGAAGVAPAAGPADPASPVDLMGRFDGAAGEAASAAAPTPIDDTPASWSSTLPLPLRGVARAIAKRAVYCAAVAIALSTLLPRCIVATLEGHHFCETQAGMSLWVVAGRLGELSRFLGNIDALSLDEDAKALCAVFMGSGARGVKPPPWPVKLQNFNPETRKQFRKICRAAMKWGVECGDIRDMLVRHDAEQELLSCVDQRHIVSPELLPITPSRSFNLAKSFNISDPSLSPRSVTPVSPRKTVVDAIAAGRGPPSPCTPLHTADISLMGTSMLSNASFTTPTAQHAHGATTGSRPATPLTGGKRTPSGLRKGTMKQAHQAAAQGAAAGGVVMCDKAPRCGVEEVDGGGAHDVPEAHAAAAAATPGAGASSAGDLTVQSPPPMSIPRSASGVDIVKRPKYAHVLASHEIEAAAGAAGGGRRISDVVAASVKAATRAANDVIYSETALRRHVETSARARNLGRGVEPVDRMVSPAVASRAKSFHPSIEAYHLTYEEGLFGGRVVGSATRQRVDAPRPSTSGGTRRRVHHGRPGGPGGLVRALSAGLGGRKRASSAAPNRQPYLVRGSNHSPCASLQAPCATPNTHTQSMHTEMAELAALVRDEEALAKQKRK